MTYNVRNKILFGGIFMLQKENSLLLIIDIQEKLVKMVGPNNPVSQNCQKLLKASAILNIPCIITEQYPKGLGETISEIKSANPTAKYFEKTSFSAISTEEIKKAIITSEKKQVILCGIEAHICVLQTALELLSIGIEVFVVKDACASRKEDNFNNAFNRLAQEGARITDTEITLFELLRSSTHPNFKEIQSLIK